VPRIGRRITRQADPQLQLLAQALFDTNLTPQTLYPDAQTGGWKPAHLAEQGKDGASRSLLNALLGT